MVYWMIPDRDGLVKKEKKGNDPIWAKTSNVDEIEYPESKKNLARIDISKVVFTDNWPEVIFYYDKNDSERESAYLFNIDGWPIIHTDVQKALEKLDIIGIQYLPIKLYEINTNKKNSNYVFMNVLNHIDAIDMEKSKYTYNEEFDAYFFDYNMVLDKEAYNGYDIFRPIKSPGYLFGSKKIKKLFEENNWFGYNFEPMPDNG